MNKIILLVEDNPDDAELALRALHKHTRNKVVVARDGVEALDILFGTGIYSGRNVPINPALVLLDLKLPKMDGLEVLRRIKQDSRTSSIPVIIFSSSTEEQDIFNSYRLGASSYVSKPVDYSRHSDCLKQVMAYWHDLVLLPHDDRRPGEPTCNRSSLTRI